MFHLSATELKKMLEDQFEWECDSLKSFVFDKDDSPFFNDDRGDYIDYKHGYVCDASFNVMSYDDIKIIVDKIGVFHLMDMMEDKIKNKTAWMFCWSHYYDLSNFMKETIPERYNLLMVIVLHEYLEGEEIIIANSELDADDESDADTDEEN